MEGVALDAQVPVRPVGRRRAADRSAGRPRGAGDRRPAGRGAARTLVRRTGDDRRPHVQLHRRRDRAPLRRHGRERRARPERPRAAALWRRPPSRRRSRSTATGTTRSEAGDLQRPMGVWLDYRLALRRGVHKKVQAGERRSCGPELLRRPRAVACDEPTTAARARRPVRAAGRERDREGHRRGQRRGESRGATVAGRTTAADGTATVGPFTPRGEQDLKASKPGRRALQPPARLRQRRARRLVQHHGAGGGLRAAGRARHDAHRGATVAGLRNGAVYSRRRAPRLLRGSVAADPSGLYSVKLRLTRRVGRRCSYFSGRRERFVRMRCGRGSFLRIGDRADWSYLLPEAARPRPLRARGEGDRRRVQPRRAGAGALPGALMRLVLLAAGLALLALAAPAGAGAASVELMVVGKARVLREAAPVKLRARSLRVGGRRCAVGRATPLSALAGTRLALRLRDYGSCSRSPADAGCALRHAGRAGPRRRLARLGLQGRPPRRDDRRRRSVGPVRHRAAAARRPAAVVLVRAGPRGGCQRTLEARPERSSASRRARRCA